MRSILHKNIFILYLNALTINLNKKNTINLEPENKKSDETSVYNIIYYNIIIPSSISYLILFNSETT